MLIIKGAAPAVAAMRSVRGSLSRIDADREHNKFDIYFDSKHGINFELVPVFEETYLNVRVYVDRRTMASFQINTKDFDKVIII